MSLFLQVPLFIAGVLLTVMAMVGVIYLLSHGVAAAVSMSTAYHAIVDKAEQERCPSPPQPSRRGNWKIATEVLFSMGLMVLIGWLLFTFYSGRGAISMGLLFLYSAGSLFWGAFCRARKCYRHHRLVRKLLLVPFFNFTAAGLLGAVFLFLGLPLVMPLFAR